ncbi:hypothetical protein [Rhodoflexus sp.]
MQHSKSAIGRTIGMILLVFYTLAVYPLSLLQEQSALPVKKETAAQTDSNLSDTNEQGAPEESSKRTIISEASDLEAVISSVVQCAIPKWQLQAPLFFLLAAVRELPVVKPLHQIALPVYVEVLFETLILPNAP